jgi:hypothetical protein
VQRLPAPVPTAVRDAVDACLLAVDDVAPGLVEGFYVVGSAAWSDFRPGVSDVVAVTPGPRRWLGGG